MSEKHLLIPEGLAVIILNYLASRPYAEVYKHITAMQNLKEAPAPAETPAADPKAKAS